ITVNNIALGTMKTPVSAAMWDDPDNPQAKALLQSYVVRRPGEPDDVAGLALYLASPMSSWITGQTYPVNGGFSSALCLPSRFLLAFPPLQGRKSEPERGVRARLPGMPITSGFNHVATITADADRIAAFYGTVFGAEITFE